MSNDKSLFEGFSPISAKMWKQKIQVDLKGADYQNTLLTPTNSGVVIKPFYNEEANKVLKVPKQKGDFLICQSLFINSDKTANYYAKDALKRGADTIKFIANKVFDYKVLLNGLLSKNIKIDIEIKFLDADFIQSLNQFIADKNIHVKVDVIGNLTNTGNWYFNRDKDFKVLESILIKDGNKLSLFYIDVAHYQNSGANIVQQIAYALSHANEYLNFVYKLYETDKLSFSQLEEVVQNMQFYFAVGSNYFFEIAKFRSFRVLWELLLKEYDLKADANIIAEPSLRNKSIYDYNVNMLRTSTECMSAIIGGVNAVSNLAYDTLFHKKNEFGERISRNQLIILKEESNIKNSNFAEGSYYIESLTAEISEKSLTTFKGIEKSGGFLEQLSKGVIQRKIIESAEKEQNQLDANELVLLGVNKFPNEKDAMKDDLQLYPFLKVNKRETIINPIISKRLSETIEQERLQQESNQRKL